MKIRGNTIGIPNPQPNWDQTDPTQADYIHNKPTEYVIASQTEPDRVPALWFNTGGSNVELGAIENNGLMVYLDSEGNKNILYPITKTSLVDGLEDELNAIAKSCDPTVHTSDKNNPHGVTAEQVGAEPAIQSTDRLDCYYRMVGDEKEWLNPPMISGTEYRTTERLHGSPVYMKFIDYGYINAGSTTFAHGISSISEAFQIRMMNGAQDITTDGGVSHLSFDATNVGFKTDWPAGAIRILLKYSKAVNPL